MNRFAVLLSESILCCVLNFFVFNVFLLFFNYLILFTRAEIDMLSNIKISKHYYENMMNALENNKKALKEEYLKAFGKGIYFFSALFICFALLY